MSNICLLPDTFEPEAATAAKFWSIEFAKSNSNPLQPSPADLVVESIKSRLGYDEPRKFAVGLDRNLMLVDEDLVERFRLTLQTRIFQILRPDLNVDSLTTPTIAWTEEAILIQRLSLINDYQPMGLLDGLVKSVGIDPDNTTFPPKIATDLCLGLVTARETEFYPDSRQILYLNQDVHPQLTAALLNETGLNSPADLVGQRVSEKNFI